MQEELTFRTRSFIFAPKEKKITILLQKDNGPCMLIAIFNSLVLKGKIKIQPGNYSASLIIDLIIGICPGLVNYGDNLLSLIDGCSVNPVFSSINEFKEYPEFLKLLHLQMYHGMIPDPASPSFDIVSNLDHEALEMKILDLESSTYLLNTKNAQNENSNANNNQEKNLELSNEDKKTLRMLREFHNLIQRQITDVGIQAIETAMKNGDVVILFRSSHFSVLFKHMNRVFNLITDESFNGSNCVWETLPDETGDSKYFDQDFILSTLAMNQNKPKQATYQNCYQTNNQNYYQNNQQTTYQNYYQNNQQTCHQNCYQSGSGNHSNAQYVSNYQQRNPYATGNSAQMQPNLYPKPNNVNKSASCQPQTASSSKAKKKSKSKKKKHDDCLIF